MPIKRIKDESKCVQKWTLRIIKPKKYFYFHVFLWENQKSFDENTFGNKPNEAMACVNLAPTIIEITTKGKKSTEREIIRPKLGEIHFIKNNWNTETVAHELFHAFIHRLRSVKDPTAEQIIEQEGTSEEDICYEFGQWFDQLYRELWAINPPKKRRTRYAKAK